MSGGSSTNNSWTILAPEETAAETLRPLAEGTEQHEEGLTSVAGSGENQAAESAEGLPVEGHLVSEEKTAELSGDTSTEEHTSVPTAVTDAPDAPDPASMEVPESGGFVPGGDALSQSEGLPEGPAQSSADPDSFSDSYTHISPSPSPDEPPASLLSTETLGGGEFTQEEELLAQEEEQLAQEEEQLAQEGTLHPLNGEELQQEGEESDLFLRMTDLGKQADSPVDSEVGEEKTEKTGEDAEPEVRRRRSLLAALERIGRTEEEEEEEGEEEFQLPQREEDSGFSVNKCILGAIILVGLGTIFFSGVFMDLDEESDYGTVELKDAEVPGKQEWLNPEVPPPPVDADSTELLNKLAEGNQQISVLQAQLQAQKEELKVANGQAAEGAKERLRWEEVEKENSRLKKEMASLLVLQKENERMKRELQSVPALQKELETLRSTVTELKLPSAAGEAAQAPVKSTTSPSSGQPEESTQSAAGSPERQPDKKSWDEQREKKKDVKKDQIDMGEKKERKGRDKSEWKEGEKKERKDGGKAERKKGKFDEEGKQKKYNDETKQWGEKDGKKEKASRGDEGKPWKDREGKWVEKSERKERKEEKEWKKAKHEKVKEGKQWGGKEEKKKDWKVGKEHGEKHKGKEEWKKGKDVFKGSGKEKWEKKDWKEKGEKKEWKSKNDKDRGKEWRGKGERKQWDESKSHGKERKGKDERKDNERKSKNGKDDKEWRKKDERKEWGKKEEPWKRAGEKRDGDRKKDGSSPQKRKDERKSSGNHKEEHLWGGGKPPHTHSRPSPEQPEYWVQQRARLQRNPKPAQQCDSLETCAQAEGLLPVPLPEFEAVLQTYLAKAAEAGVDASITEELKKLAAEFFEDGVFVHDRTSFEDFVEDLEDILEDMVEGDDEEEEDSAAEEEMERFEREVMQKFSAPGAAEKEERSKGERRKESGRGRG